MQNILTSFVVDTDFMKNISAKFDLNPRNCVTLDLFSC